MKAFPFLSILLLLVTFIACQPKEKKNETALKPLQNDLPALQMVTTTGRPIFAKALTGKIVIVLFQPDCDHCQREAVQIRENLKAFDSYELYFISNVTDQELIKFAKDYKFDTASNIHFATTTADQIISSFGPLDTPSLFIYAAEGKLVHKFIGETDISKILPVL